MADHSQMKLGKLPVKKDTRNLMFAKYLASPDALPDIPDTYVWSKDMPDWGMMKNDQIGDCTIAAGGHLIMSWSKDNGNEPISDKGSIEIGSGGGGNIIKGNKIFGVPLNWVYGTLAVLGVSFTLIAIYGKVKYRKKS